MSTDCLHMIAYHSALLRPVYLRYKPPCDHVDRLWGFKFTDKACRLMLRFKVKLFMQQIFYIYNCVFLQHMRFKHSGYVMYQCHYTVTSKWDVWISVLLTFFQKYFREKARCFTKTGNKRRKCLFTEWRKRSLILGKVLTKSAFHI